MTAAVLFDLDETLLDRTTSLKAFLAAQYGRFSSALGGVSLERWQDRFLELDQRGRVSKSLVYPALLAESGCDPSLASEMLSDYQRRCCARAALSRYAGNARNAPT
jgi:putative hydrolase of the HAD superfamily